MHPPCGPGGADCMKLAPTRRDRGYTVLRQAPRRRFAGVPAFRRALLLIRALFRRIGLRADSRSGTVQCRLVGWWWRERFGRPGLSGNRRWECGCCRGWRQRGSGWRRGSWWSGPNLQPNRLQILLARRPTDGRLLPLGVVGVRRPSGFHDEHVLRPEVGLPIAEWTRSTERGLSNLCVHQPGRCEGGVLSALLQSQRRLRRDRRCDGHRRPEFRLHGCMGGHRAILHPLMSGCGAACGCGREAWHAAMRQCA